MKQYRDELLARMAKAYRRYRRLELSLDRPPLNRTFKDKKCKRAIAVAEKREEVLQEMQALRTDIYKNWMQLGEVRHDPALQLTGTAMRFAAELTKPKRNPRFLKNQTSALPEEAGRNITGRGR